MAFKESLVRTTVGFVLLFSSLVACAQTRENRCDAYEVLSAAGDVYAETELAYCYLRGIGRAQDTDMAKAHLQSAIEGGSVKARVSLASVYLFETKEEDQYAEAVRQLNIARAEGSRNVAVPLAAAYHSGLGVTRNDEMALEQLQEAGHEGHVLAAFVLYAISTTGMYGTEADPEAATFWRNRFFEIADSSPGIEAQTYLNSLRSDEFTIQYLLDDESVNLAVQLAEDNLGQ